MHFWPGVCGIGTQSTSAKAPERAFCFDKGADRGTKPGASSHDRPELTRVQYWGAMAGFDVNVRRESNDTILISPREFEQILAASFRALGSARGKDIRKSLYFVTAWNEWNEQAVLEPSDTHKFGYLEALRRSLRSVAASRVHIYN